METNVIYNEDCLGKKGMQRLPNSSIDMILADLPYGTTQNKWDSVIPLEPLWEQYKRVTREDSAIVLTSSQPFTTKLINSNPDMFRYDLVWDKKLPSGFLNANRMPLRQHEIILVFYEKLPNYNPIMETRGKPRTKGVATESGDHGTTYGKYDSESKVNNEYYPTSIIEVSHANRERRHPSEKPIDLFKYLIKTYTNEGDVILDNVIGSGTTAVACKSIDREFIGFEKNEEYVTIARERLRSVQKELIR